MARGADAGVAPRPDTPGARGFVHPAEWEPHAATWLAWPHKRSDWPGKFAPIPWVFAEIVRALAPGEKVRLIVASPRARAEALRVL
ncbi:MAG: agmatine deiminase family protein, partial [Planctomycetes bacterium]|nr:agmatine deiminase family protein [Planctomycetota bacterium]